MKKDEFNSNPEMSVFELKRKYLRHESKVSRDIRILAEVEKIWIKYDLDGNGLLDYEEVA